MSGTQRTLALFVVILASFGLWLHSSDKLIPFMEALFGGGGGGAKVAAPTTSTAPAVPGGAPALPSSGGLGGGAFKLPSMPSLPDITTILGETLGL